MSAYTPNSGSLLTLTTPSGGQVLKPSHQTCTDQANLPKYTYIQRNGALPSTWSGSETFVEFELPRELGVVDQLIVRFQVAVATASVVLPPTPFWVSRLEEYIGSDLLATTYANDQYNETIGFLDPTGFAQSFATLNTTSSYGNGTIATGTSYYYLPLVASSFNTMNPYVAGFNATLKVRLYFPSSIIASGSGTISLTDVILIARELKSNNYEMLRSGHKMGIVDYSMIVRERHMENASLTSGLVNPVLLRSLKNDSAGLLVYLTDQSPTNAQLKDRTAITDFQLLDATNNRITEVIRDDFAGVYTWTDAIDSVFPTANANNKVNALPFSADFQQSANTGCDFGRYAFTTNEKLNITPSSTASKTIYVTSYSYGHVVVRQGNHRILMTSSYQK
jgi:hypothetical protein